MSYTWLSQWMCTGGWSFHIKCVWWILDQGGRPNLFEMSQIINHARRPITSNGSFHKCRENIILSARNVKTVHIHHSLYCSSCIQLQEEETLFWLEGDFNYWFFFFFKQRFVIGGLTCHFNDLMPGDVIEGMVPGQVGRVSIEALGEVRLWNTPTCVPLFIY